MKISFDYETVEQAISFLFGKIKENEAEINKLQSGWKSMFTLLRQMKLINENEKSINKLDFLLKKQGQSIQNEYNNN